MKAPQQGWVQRWLPSTLVFLGALIVIGLAFDVLTRSRLSATTTLACDGEYADTLQVQSVRARGVDQGPQSQFS